MLGSCFLKQVIHDFYDSGLSTGNQLLKAVEADSKVDEHWAACRALGLVSKLKILLQDLLEFDTTILEKYQHMVACFEKWALRTRSSHASKETWLVYAPFRPAVTMPSNPSTFLRTC